MPLLMKQKADSWLRLPYTFLVTWQYLLFQPYFDAMSADLPDVGTLPGRGCNPVRDVCRITADEPFGRGCKPRPAKGLQTPSGKGMFAVSPLMNLSDGVANPVRQKPRPAKFAVSPLMNLSDGVANPVRQRLS